MESKMETLPAICSQFVPQALSDLGTDGIQYFVT
jgi:hypothetical protein